MSTTSADRVTICTDCTMILANGDDSGMSQAQATASRNGLATLAASYGADAILSVSDDVDDFDTHACPACGTGLAGARVAVDVVWREPYVVIYASAGCLPDGDDEPATFGTTREAWEYVANEVEQIDDDGDYLEAHTALHVVNRDAVGSVPGRGLYAWHVETND